MLHYLYISVMLLALAWAGAAQPADPVLTRAYADVAGKHYDEAIAGFRAALAVNPRRAALHKDLAYALLKTGEDVQARDEFAAAMAVDPHDEPAALEFAFLAYETGKAGEAQEIFRRLQAQGSTAATRATAKQAYANISNAANPPQFAGSTRASSALFPSSPVRAASVSVFFDPAYRSRADLDYLVDRWRRSGFGTVYVAAWHNMEPNSERDERLGKLISACHRNGILTYAWFELPFVSEAFWAAHPQWREQTGSGHDAEVGWRKLMNLQNPACSREVKRLMDANVQRFDWDGINLGELQFESEPALPDQFTPMNGDVREEFKTIAELDPQSLFHGPSDAPAMKQFLQFRSVLLARLQTEWLAELQALRQNKPYLDVVVIEAGAASETERRAVQQIDATLLMEGVPALGAKFDRHSGVDLNAGQLGARFFDSLHAAAQVAPQVAIYAEHSIGAADLPSVAVAACGATAVSTTPDETTVTSLAPVRLQWQGPAEVDGEPWSVSDGTALLLPSGTHRVGIGVSDVAPLVSGFNGDMQSVKSSADSVRFSYTRGGRTFLTLASDRSKVDVDGMALPGSGLLRVLPPGEHVVTVTR